MIVELLVAVFLEKTTKKNSKNSSIPLSQTNKDESSTATGTNGKGTKENEHPFANSRVVHNESISAVDNCSTCGEDLRDTPCDEHERRTRIDIIFENVVEHVDAEIKCCPNCQSVTKGEFPADMAGPLQYGLGIKAYVLNLIFARMVSLSRVRKMLGSLVGAAISEATLLKYVLALYNALEQWERQATQKLLRSPVIHVDETSMRVEKAKRWIHVRSAGDITLKFLHKGRGHIAVRVQPVTIN